MRKIMIEKLCREIRQKVFEIVCNNKAGHLASSLSSVEILATLYFGGILNYRADQPEWEERDRFVLSKGHAALGFYITLAKAGYFDLNEVDTFCIAGTRYGGLPLREKVKGVEATTGSLGHGLSFAAGIAMYAQIYHKAFHVYTLIGDGESQEGSVWEAAMFVAQNQLTNLVIIVDNNKIQATGRCEDIVGVEPMNKKWEAFGFEVLEVDGHDVTALQEALDISELRLEKPRVVIAHTIKGKGLSFVENQSDWHYKMPTREQIEIGMRELNIPREVISEL